jgi:hypothetical protein
MARISGIALVLVAGKSLLAEVSQIFDLKAWHL